MSRSKKIVEHFEHAQLSNASKTLLANIRFASVDEKVKTLVVTSSGANEGKTIVSTNLANAIATSGEKVLIVEGDMRRRTLGKLLDMHPANGIYAVLSGSAKLSEAIVPTRIPNLYFMDAESSIPSPSDVLSTRRFASLVEKLRDSFDYVIFDTPPVSLFVDAAIISSLVDGTLFVVRQNVTKRALATKCVQQLRVADARILGTVMTFCSDDESNYYYAYYTKEGKRVNKKEASDRLIPPSDFDNAVDATWDQDFQVAPKRRREGGVPAYPATPNSPGIPKGSNNVPAGNPYAPNAFKAVMPGTAGPHKGTHKKMRRS